MLPAGLLLLTSTPSASPRAVYAAISGEGLADAGRSVTALLKRTLLECWATTVWFAPFVVGMTSLLVSAAYGAAAGALFWLSQRSHPGADAELAKELGIAAGLACLFVTGFLAGVLLRCGERQAGRCWLGSVLLPHAAGMGDVSPAAPAPHPPCALPPNMAPPLPPPTPQCAGRRFHLLGHRPRQQHHLAA